MAEQKRKPGRPAGSTNKTKKNEGTFKQKEALEKKPRLYDEIGAVILIAIGIFLAIALQSQAAGVIGDFIRESLMGILGRIAYVMPYSLIIYGVLLFAKQTAHIGTRSTVCFFLIFFMISVLNSSFFISGKETFGMEFLTKCFDLGKLGESAGVFGMSLGLLFVKYIGKTGLWILCACTILVCILLVANTPISAFLDDLKIKREIAMIEKEKTREEEAKQEKQNKTIIEEKQKEIPVVIPQRQIAQPEIKSIMMPPPQTPVREKPVSVTKNGVMSEKQLKIIDYMKDDSLFHAENSGDPGFGLEELSERKPGLGLNPLPEKEDSTTETLGTATSEGMPMKKKVSKAPIEPLEIQNTPQPPVLCYEKPSIEFLNKPKTEKGKEGQHDLQIKAQKLEETLHNFNVNAKVVQVTRGPAVTRYEIQPNTGVKVSSIVRLADDIALNLEAKSIRMEAPIPGKAAVGIEVENEKISMVTIREIVDSQEFKSAKSKISFAVGKDISGNAIVADLKGMPHLLIAGSTGSGKSVCINSIIISILYHANPEEVKFVLIDPKVVELSNYNGIPHLLIPVVTEPTKAAAALNWAVAEMNDRYKKFAEESVRDLASFNEAVKGKGEDDRFMPQIVIIIDELADLMIAAPAQVEEAISRLAALARAAGMHLVVATQRPSVDVITGVIKANIPSRIAFAVSSQFDSRTILDMGGAEKLVGKGDMLFNPLGVAKPTRIQGCFISDQEVHRVIEFLKQNAPQAEYASDVLHSIERVQSDTNHEEDSDELLPDAIDTVVRAEQASVSMLQRRFRIGYNRAARLVDMMESRGIIGPADGSRPRKVLMSLDELEGLNQQNPSETTEKEE